MDWAGILTAAATIVTALGGLELIKYLLNRKAEKRVEEANAFDVQREALMKDYERVQGEVDELKKKVDELHVCLQPDDRCLQRLNPNDHCRLRKILRGEYAKDNPGAILTEEDMMKKETDDEDRQ